MSQLSRSRGVRQFTYCQELERATDDGDHDPDERVVQEDVHVCGVCAGLIAAGAVAADPCLATWNGPTRRRGGREGRLASTDISNTGSVQALPMKFKAKKTFKKEDFEDVLCALSEVNIIEIRYFASKWPDPNICCKK